jgi:hypothetical protein
MTYKMYGALTASLSVLALVLAANETFARAGGTQGAARSLPHSQAARSALRHHRRNNAAVFWPGFYDNGSSNGEPLAGVSQPLSNDARYTYTYDVPWDWAHRFPPAVAPSDRPYVSSCPAESVTVPGADGAEKTVNIMRCY